VPLLSKIFVERVWPANIDDVAYVVFLVAIVVMVVIIVLVVMSGMQCLMALMLMKSVQMLAEGPEDRKM
jgi:ABC-type lipoprotein release transport system permease subunit